MCTPELVSEACPQKVASSRAAAEQPQRAGTRSQKPVRVKPSPDLVFEASGEKPEQCGRPVMPSIASLLFCASLSLDFVAIQVCWKDTHV